MFTGIVQTQGKVLTITPMKGGLKLEIVVPEGFNKNLVYQITTKLEHRGPDNIGYWFNDNNQVGFGH